MDPEILGHDERGVELEPILRVARAVESEPTMIGISAHLMAVGHRPD